MADYPTLTQLNTTTREASSGIRVSRAVSGKPRFAKYSTQDWYTFKVQHYVDSTGLATLQAHYAANRMLEFDYVYTATNETYKAQYGDSPKLQTTDGEDRWVVENLLIGTGRLPFANINLKLVSSLVIVVNTARVSSAAVMTSASSIAVAKSRGSQSAVTLSNTSSLSATNVSGRNAEITLSSSSSMTAAGEKTNVNVDVTVSASSDMTAAGEKTNVNVDVTVSASSDITATGTNP
jgi:hypothetical protein